MTIDSLDILFSQFEPVHCSMSCSNCCFLICIQVSQEVGRVIWYSHLFKNFHSLLWSRSQRLSRNNEAEVDVFWNSFAFSIISQMLTIWSLVPLPFLNPACTSRTSWFMYSWSLAWRILSITLLACKMNAIVGWFEHSLALPFLGLKWKLTFSSPSSTR